MPSFKLTALLLVFCWFAIGGVCHFVFTRDFMAAMPPYLPLHYEAVIVSGVFELLGAGGLLWPRTRKFAGYGLIALTVLVTPANVHMWLYPELFPQISPIFLLLRLPLQVLLIVCIWWAVQPVKKAE